MNVLHLTLKKKWFDMILSGEKTEEYRELKPYWRNRLQYFDIVSRNNIETFKKYYAFKRFDVIRFSHGYARNAPTFDIECKGISIGTGRPEWGCGSETFIISLGKIISTANLTNKNS